MGYLDQLRNLSDVANGEPKETKESGKVNCLGFLGPADGILKKHDVAERARCWLLHFADREPLAVTVSPPASHAEVLDTYPGALAAEPIEPSRYQPDAPLPQDQEGAIVAWLAKIGETDEAMVSDVLAQCRHNAETRAYYLDRVGIEQADDRRRCTECDNLRGGVCTVARPGGQVSAVRGYRPSLVDVPIRCAGYTART